MRSKSLILGLCATTVAATGAIAAFAGKMVQTQYFVKIGTTVRLITPPPTSSTFTGCFGSPNVCRVTLVTPSGVVLTEATTVYTNSSATAAAQAANALSGIVIIQ